MESHDITAAAALFGVLLSSAPAEAGARDQARAALASGAWRETFQHAKAALAGAPRDRELLLWARLALQNIAREHAVAGRGDKALVALERAERITVPGMPESVREHAGRVRDLTVRALAESFSSSTSAPAGAAPGPLPSVAVPRPLPSVAVPRPLPSVAVPRPEDLPPVTRAPVAPAMSQDEHDAVKAAGEAEAAGDIPRAVELAMAGLRHWPENYWLLKIVGRHDPAARGVSGRGKRVASSAYQVEFRGLEPDAELEARVCAAVDVAVATVTAKLPCEMGRVRVVIHASSRDYARVGAAAWSAACYDGAVQIPMEVAKAGTFLTETATHEIAHHAVARLSRNRAPRWFDEGIAQLVAGEDRGQAARDVLAAGGTLPRLSALMLRIDGAGPGTQTAAYGKAFLIVQDLEATHGLAAVQGVLADLAHGTRFDAALQSSFGRSMAEIENDWTAKQGK